MSDENKEQPTESNEQPAGEASEGQVPAKRPRGFQPKNGVSNNPNSANKDTFNLSALKPRHREIILRLVYHGHTKRQICRDLGFNERYFSLITNSPLFKAELQKEIEVRQKDERQRRLNQLSDPAIKIIEQIVTKGRAEFVVVDPDNPDKMVTNVVRVTGRTLVDLVNSLLDRTGHKPIEHKKVEASLDLGKSIIAAHEQASSDDIEEALEAEIVRDDQPQLTEGNSEDTDPTSLESNVYSQSQSAARGDNEVGESESNRVHEPTLEPLCWRCQLPADDCTCPHRNDPTGAV